MGIVGTLFVAIVTALFGLVVPGPWRRRVPNAARWRGLPLVIVVVAVAVIVVMVKMIGNITGFLVDGSVVEWGICVIAAMVTTLACDAFAHPCRRAFWRQ